MANFLGFDPKNKWDYENGFYLTSDCTRMGKMLAHYELYKSITHLPGDVLEFGVYKGCSLIRFAQYREALEATCSRRIIGFDAFGQFPVVPSDSNFDKSFISQFEKQSGNGISKTELEQVFSYKKLHNIELIEGDILDTLAEYLSSNPALKIALLHIDVDVYRPTKYILEKLFERVVKGGLIILDDYGKVEGETRAVDEFFKGEASIEKLAISHIPAFIRK